jgi:hypothetical protein
LNIGVSTVVTKKFILVIPARKPYSTYNGNSLFLSSLSYIGYVVFPELKKLFPQTAYEVQDDKSLLDILKISTTN